MRTASMIRSLHECRLAGCVVEFPGEITAAAYPELAIDLTQVMLDGLCRYAQPRCDLAVPQAGRRHARDLRLARRQTVVIRARCRSEPGKLVVDARDQPCRADARQHISRS